MKNQAKQQNQGDGEEWLHKLPQELWLEVGKRLHSHLDVLRFRSTCSLWRTNLPSLSTASSPSLFPLQIPPPPGFAVDNNNPVFLCYITEATGYACSNKLPSSTQPNKSIVVVFESLKPKVKQNREGLSYATYKLYGQNRRIKLDPTHHRILDMRQSSISTLFKTYSFRIAMPRESIHATTSTNLAIEKVVVITYESKSYNPVGINPHYASTKLDEFNQAIIASLPQGGLIFLNTRSNKWENIISGNKFDDIVNYRHKCWGVDRHGETFVLDTKSLSMIRVAFLPKEAQNLVDKGRKRLVEASGELYMLFPCCDQGTNVYNSNKIKVYRLKELGWVEMESIDDYTFFVGIGFSFAIKSEKHLCFSIIDKLYEKNCIFLEGFSFCRNYRSEGHVERDYPLFEEMRLVEYAIGAYTLNSNSNSKGEGKDKEVYNKFQLMTEYVLPELFCTDASWCFTFGRYRKVGEDRLGFNVPLKRRRQD